MGGPIESLTLDTLERPNDAEESSLSQILVEVQSVPPRYYLTRKACRGYVTRQRKHGFNVPTMLQMALDDD